MPVLASTFARGQQDALSRFKLAMPKASPVVSRSALLSGKAPSPQLSSDVIEKLQPPTSPASVKQVFDVQEQGKTRLEPARKLAEALCTSCRKPKHYGPCAKPLKTKPEGVPHKQAEFNAGMHGNDVRGRQEAASGSTSPHYTSGVTGTHPLSGTHDSRPPDEQAATGFADLYRHLGITSLADQSTNNTGALDKVSRVLPIGKSTAQHVDLAFKQFDHASLGTGDSSPYVV